MLSKKFNLKFLRLLYQPERPSLRSRSPTVPRAGAGASRGSRTSAFWWSFAAVEAEVEGVADADAEAEAEVEVEAETEVNV
jgi:hypothetical protein